MNMAARDLPNLGLKGGFDLHEDEWGESMNRNLLALSTLTQGRVLDKVAALPVADLADGMVYLLDETNADHPNQVAARDAGAWVYFTPKEGWMVYNLAADYAERFDGTVWAEVVAGGADGVPEAPEDGKVYGRKDAAWVEIVEGSDDGGGGGSGPIEAVPTRLSMRYWRVIAAPDISAGEFVAIGELRWLDESGVNLVGTGTPLSGGDYNNGDFAKASAYNGDGSTTGWISPSNTRAVSWLGYDFGAEVEVYSIALAPHSGFNGAGQWPDKLLVQASDDLVTWYTTNKVVTAAPANGVYQNFNVLEYINPYAIGLVGGGGNGDGIALSAVEFKAFTDVARDIPAETDTQIAFTTDEVTVDRGNWHDPAVNPTRFTVSEDGVYSVSAFVDYAVAGGGTGFLWLRKNGNVYGVGQKFSFQTDVIHCDVVTAMRLTAGDYIELDVWQGTGGPRSLVRAGIHIIQEGAFAESGDGGGGGGSGALLADAPDDGMLYARRAGAWEPVPEAPLVYKSFRYWRFTITENQQPGSFTAVTGIEMRDQANVNRSAGGGGAFGVSGQDAGSPQRAFQPFTDNEADSGIQRLGLPLVFGYDFGEPREIHTISMTAFRGAERAPKTFIVAGSDDNVTYEEVFPVGDQTGWVLGQARVFEIPGAEAGAPIGPAPSDGRPYVSQDGAWILLEDALAALGYTTG
jgi:hypothetical protein